MAVATRKTRASAPTAKASASSKPAKKQTKKAPVEPESEPEVESEEESEEEASEDEGDQEDENEDDEDEEEEEEEEEEDTFKIHTPKASSAPRVAPAALPTMTYEDESEEDSDAAPEAESLSSAKAKILSAQDKEKSFLSKVQAEQKAKRVERDQKLKEQKEQSKSKKTKVEPSPEEVESASTEKTTRSGLPALLPMDILESVAEMDGQEGINKGADSKKRKHMRPEDFALMELEAELKAEAAKRKKAEKTQKNVGPVTVKVLDQSLLAKGHAIPETVIDFRKQHFFGSKIPRKDAVLNASQKNRGAASMFNRRK
ncbi:hypothetical protein CPB97_010340 [Podila verticillata]|nr:hypothetical protein CPB97_010340 [Podila verticillata]